MCQATISGQGATCCLWFDCHSATAPRSCPFGMGGGVDIGSSTATSYLESLRFVTSLGVDVVLSL